METEFHKLIALALLVVAGQLAFLLAVGDGDDICGLVDTALEVAFVSAACGVGIHGVNAGEVAGFVEGGVGTVGAVDGVEKGVEDAEVLAVVGVDVVVGLEELDGLRIDKGVGEFEVEIGFAAGLVDWNGCGGAVDGF